MQLTYHESTKKVDRESVLFFKCQEGCSKLKTAD